jgi:AcrR family transcriptional regulator
MVKSRTALAMVMRTASIKRSGPLRAGRRERRRAEIRERIFRAALELFAERGFLETTVEDITEAADVGKGTFFNYFPTKEHVLATLGAERLAVIERAHKRAQTGAVLPTLRGMAIELAGHSSESAALLRAIYAAHASCEPVRAELLKRLHAARRLLTEIYHIAQERGEVRRDRSPAELAQLTQIVFFGIVLAWAMNPDSSLHKTAEDVWNLLSADLGVERTHRSGGEQRSERC